MKLKLILLIAGAAVIGSSITIVIIQSNDRAKRHEMERRQTESGNRLQSAFSNYNKTFKLNTNPPLWPDAATNRGLQDRR